MQTLRNLLLLTSVVVLCTAAAEGAVRALGWGHDFLGTTLVVDERYGHRVASGAATDDWGFRNASVPAKANIVAIGDSQTFGVNASAAGSWPAQLDVRMGQTVYNLSVGGYGPIQYDRLWDDYVDRLKPSTVVVALYLGNDIHDAFAYSALLPAADPLRPVAPPPLPSVEEEKPDGLVAALRVFLFRHSVLYNMARVAFPRLADRLKGLTRAAPADDRGGAARLSDRLGTSFDAAMRLDALRLDRPANAEGLRITLGLIERLAAKCASSRRRCLLAVIPTKESVYETPARDAGLNDATLTSLWNAEGVVRRRILDVSAALGLPAVDLLPGLLQAALHESIYPAFDGHPNKLGYAIIADEVAATLKTPR